MTISEEHQFFSEVEKNIKEFHHSPIAIKSNIFKCRNYKSRWKKYKKIDFKAVSNTFKYMFYKMKKGIFVRIQEGEVKLFLPFSNTNYVNEWSDKIKVEDKYENIEDFIKYITEMSGYRYKQNSVNKNINNWYGNNCLVRYEYPVRENDTNISIIKNMFEDLCKKRTVPDIEFFINKRDYPILKSDSTEPYNHMWDSNNKPLISHCYEKYAPIFSMSSCKGFSDILMPTWDDWARVKHREGVVFKDTMNKQYPEKFTTTWKDKKPLAVFRGGTTGHGVDVNTNKRLKACYLSYLNPDIIDAKITNWNLRPRKLFKEKYLKTIDITKIPFSLGDRLSPEKQAEYKYILHIEGHVAAYRLSLEMSMGSCILMVGTEWDLWYSHLLEANVHYIPVKSDLSDLVEVIEWCRLNDDKCEEIARNSVEFYNKYLVEDGVLDYMQKLMIDTKRVVGKYNYNHTKIREIQMAKQLTFLEKFKKSKMYSIPLNISRCYGLMKGIQLSLDVESITKEDLLLTTRTSKIYVHSMANYNFVVKESNKKAEYINEAFVGTKGLNNVLKYVPNFCYIYGYYTKDDTHNIISEYIDGITLKEYINSPEFTVDDMLSIYMQLSLALNVAQEECSFIHWNLNQWNVIIQQIDKHVEFDYVINGVVNRVRTNIIPVIIDYGTSHIVYDGIHYGLVNPYVFDSSQDMRSVIVNTLVQILESRRLRSSEFELFYKLILFFYPNAPKSKLVPFLKKKKKYSSMVYFPPKQCENTSIIDFLKQLTNEKFTSYPEKYINKMNKVDALQVSRYIKKKNPDNIHLDKNIVDVPKKVVPAIICENICFNKYSFNDDEFVKKYANKDFVKDTYSNINTCIWLAKEII